ncbi:hypothetical protein LA6_003201 [Marinibacterium anthonyi]|nr:hypothetical protein LA6_003201 [Marinibacterium anthonyi]
MTRLKPPNALSLFDLLARSWPLDAEIRELLFNGAGTALMAVLDDGRLAFVSVRDGEHPDSRVRIEVDTGRSSIRPRTKPLPAPVFTDAPVARVAVRPCRLGDQGYAFAHVGDARLWRATARGQTLAVKGGTRVSALAALPGAERLARADGSRLSILPVVGGDDLAAVMLTHAVSRIAVSPDGGLLCCFGDERLSIVETATLSVRAPVQVGDEVLALAWSPCGRWLVAGGQNKAVLLVDVPAGTCDRIVDFPQPVGSLGFNARAGALIAGGAFRVVGWRLPDLPFGKHAGDPIVTGRPGLTIVDHVAGHPDRDLCAVAYANGLIVLCRVGHPDEMLLREGTGVPVNALHWSDDGAHLAIGDADGTLSIATFPKTMFK